MSCRDLPQEILRDILERLPVKTLIIIRSVCKSWYSIITDRGFIASHIKKVKLHNNGCLLCVPWSRCDPQMCTVMCTRSLAENFNLPFPFDLEYFHMAIVGSCSGVVCLTAYDRYDFGRIVYLWNPSIRKFKTLPRSPHVRPQFFDWLTSVVLGQGFDHVSGDQKIVRLSYFWDIKEKEFCHDIESYFWDNQEKEFCQSDIEVYSLQTNSWRRIEATVSCRAHRSSTVFVNGAIHWIAYRPKGPDHHLILSFDFSNEVFQELMLPVSCYNGIGTYTEVVAEFNGSLSLLINDSLDYWVSNCCHMWVMNTYGDAKSWVKQFKLVDEEGIYRLPGLANDGRIIYQNYKMEYFLCDPVDGTQKKIGLDGIDGDVVGFMESLILLEEQ